MLAEDANMQKQKKREEQIKNWREREFNDPLLINDSSSSSSSSNFDIKKNQQLQQQKQREIRVKFPKGCVFLAACSSGDIDEVKQYLKYGVNINTTNIDGLTALHQACIDANLDMVKFLIENGADIDVQDNEGWTPLHAAVSVGNLEVVK
jgi:ankyrin repeat protein